MGVPSYLTLCLPAAALLYPYGLDKGDSKNPKLDDGTSKRVVLSVPFSFYGKEYETLYVRETELHTLRTSLHFPSSPPPPPFFFAPSFSLFCPLQPQSQPFRGIDSVSLACFCFFFLVYQSILAGVGGLGGELALLAQRLGGGWTSSGVLCPTSPPCFE